MDIKQIKKKDAVIKTPFGKKTIVYADYSASGRPSNTIDKQLDKILPYYANTHSNAALGQKMSNVIEQVRKDIKLFFTMPKNSIVLFQGTGASGAISQLVHCLNITTKDTAVFISEIEHHSNLLPWLPYKPTVIPLTSDLLYIDVVAFENSLKKCTKSKKIASFCAVSNVTGIIQPVKDLIKIAHKYDCRIILDDAAGAPYIDLSVRPDALVFSPHKMKGGQGCPGVLISSPTMFESRVPYVSGGGTVRFVCKHGAEYSKKIETRESGGSPNVIGIARLGLVLKHIKRQKMSVFKKINAYMAKRLLKMQHIKLAVPESATVLNRLPVWSFIVTINGEIIHYNLVVAILNDVFGIQSRGGISCASFYAQRIFGIHSATLKKLDEMFGNDCSEYGWVRISLAGTTSKKVQRFICDAVSQLPALITKYKTFYKYDRTHNRFVFKQK